MSAEFNLVIAVLLNGSVRSTQGLLVNETEAISSLKERIAGCTGITVAHQRLEYQGQTLSEWNNVQSLLDLDITAVTNAPCMVVHNIEADAAEEAARSGARPDDPVQRTIRVAAQTLFRATVVYRQAMLKSAPLIEAARMQGDALMAQAEASLPPALQAQLREPAVRAQVSNTTQLGLFTVGVVLAFRIVVRRVMQLFFFLFDRFPIRLGLYLCCAKIGQMFYKGDLSLSELLSADRNPAGQPADASFDGQMKRVARVAVHMVNMVSPGLLAELQRQ